MSTIQLWESGAARGCRRLGARDRERVRAVAERCRANGVVHAVNAAPSSEHSNVAAASLLGEREVAGRVVRRVRLGAPIVVSGASVDAPRVATRRRSRLPAASVALTANVCEPFARRRAIGVEHGVNAAPSTDTRTSPRLVAREREVTGRVR